MCFEIPPAQYAAGLKIDAIKAAGKQLTIAQDWRRDHVAIIEQHLQKNGIKTVVTSAWDAYNRRRSYTLYAN